MLKERDFEHEGSLFMHASQAAQKDAAIRFIQTIPQKEYITEIENLIVESETSSDIAIRAAIHAYDFLLSDEIRSYFPERSPETADAASVYYRSDVYKQDYPQSILDAITSEIRDIPTDIVIATSDHIDNFSPGSGFQGMLTPELAYWVGTETNPITKPDPPCGIARQEIYRSLLKCGINPLQEVLDDEDNDRVRPDRKYQTMFKRKGEISLKATPEDLKGWEQNSATHWGNILKENEGEIQDSILFSSGTSSAEAIMLALSQRCGGETYVHPYWYYENIPTTQETLHTSKRMSADTQIILLNLEPTNFFTFDEAQEIESPTETLAKLAQLCREDPDTNRYVVIDVTVDPLFKATEYIEDEAPNNLYIIKTLSASKHQRGGRKYFFGVAYTSDIDLAAETTQARPRVGGNIYEPHIVHFPRPSAAWLAKQRDIVKGINSQVANNVAHKNESGWILRPHTYHVFFFPPPEVLERIQTLGTQNGNVDAEVKQFNDAVSQIVANVVSEVDSPFIDLGDSFGLPFTRVCTQGGYNELNGVKFRLKLPRICPGYDTSPALVEDTVHRLLDQLSVSHDKIIDTLN